MNRAILLIALLSACAHDQTELNQRMFDAYHDIGDAARALAADIDNGMPAAEAAEPYRQLINAKWDVDYAGTLVYRGEYSEANERLEAAKEKVKKAKLVVGAEK